MTKKPTEIVANLLAYLLKVTICSYIYIKEFFKNTISENFVLFFCQFSVSNQSATVATPLKYKLKKSGLGWKYVEVAMSKVKQISQKVPGNKFTEELQKHPKKVWIIETKYKE